MLAVEDYEIGSVVKDEALITTTLRLVGVSANEIAELPTRTAVK